MEKNVNKNLKVKCPHCEETFSYYESEFRPFCCERCKMIDLGHWFNETYSVPSKDQVSDEPELLEEEDENNNSEDQSDY